MRQVLPVFVLASLVCVAQSGGESAATSTPSDIDEDLGEVEEQLCGDVVSLVLSLSWNFLVSHDKYIARPSSKEPR